MWSWSWWQLTSNLETDSFPIFNTDGYYSLVLPLHLCTEKTVRIHPVRILRTFLIGFLVKMQHLMSHGDGVSVRQKLIR